MTTKRVAITITTLAAAAAAVSVSAALAGAAPSAKIVITHQTKGCHSWVLNGGAFKPIQQLALRRGGYVTITNNDVMPHKLLTLSAAGTVLATPAMNHMGATSTVTLPKQPGVYTFTTKAGEDYTKGVKTIGPDNTLKLKVIVA